MAHDVEALSAALAKSRDRLLSHARVVATTDALAVVCSVTEKVALNTLRPRDRVPSTIDGIPTTSCPPA